MDHYHAVFKLPVLVCADRIASRADRCRVYKHFEAVMGRTYSPTENQVDT